MVVLSSMPADHLRGKAGLRGHRFGVSSAFLSFSNLARLSLADPLFIYLFPSDNEYSRGSFALIASRSALAVPFLFLQPAATAALSFLVA